MAQIDYSKIEDFVTTLLNHEKGEATDNDVEAAAAAVAELNFGRYTSKKFAEMFSKIRSTTASLTDAQGVTHNYTLSASGASSLFELLEEGNALEPKYENGKIVINTDTTKDTVVIGGAFEDTPPVVPTVSENKFTIGDTEYTYDNSTKKIMDGEKEVASVSDGAFLLNGVKFLAPVNNSGVMTSVREKKVATQIKGDDIILNDTTLTDYTYISVLPSKIDNKIGTVTLNNITIDGSDGKLNAYDGTNTPLVISTGGSIVIRNLSEIANSVPTQGIAANNKNSIYNGIEIWGRNYGTSQNVDWKNPTSVTIKDSVFKNNFYNNGINIFGLANGAKVSIENCIFDGASNILRIGSMNNGFENSYNCVIEFKNCVFRNWDTDAGWGSFCLCQFDDKDANSNPSKNIYGTDTNGTHITIKFIDCYRSLTEVSGELIPGNKIEPYGGDNSSQFGPNVFVTGTNTVDTQNRLLIMCYWDKINSQWRFPDPLLPEWTNWYPKFEIANTNNQNVVANLNSAIAKYVELGGLPS